MKLALLLSLVSLPGLLSQGITGDTIHVLEGGDTTLKCMLGTQQIVWTVDRGLVSLATRLPYAHVTSDGNLTLTHIPLEADRSRFACNDRAHLGSNANTFLLDVKALELPRFTLRPQNVTATLGQNVTLTCEGTGVPAPDIDWGFLAQSDGFPSDPTLLPGVHQSRDHTQLTIEGLGPQHLGVYNCRLRNSKGQVVSQASVHLA